MLRHINLIATIVLTVEEFSIEGLRVNISGTSIQLRQESTFFRFFLASDVSLLRVFRVEVRLLTKLSFLRLSPVSDCLLDHVKFIYCLSHRQVFIDWCLPYYSQNFGSWCFVVVVCRFFFLTWWYWLCEYFLFYFSGLVYMSIIIPINILDFLFLQFLNGLVLVFLYCLKQYLSWLLLWVFLMIRYILSVY